MSAVEQITATTKPDFLKQSLQRHAENLEHADDALIDSLVEDFYCRIIEAKKHVPHGPAQMTIAYIVATCDYVRKIEKPTRDVLSRLFAQPQHHVAWMEFIDAACTEDSISRALHLTCRYIAGGLWLEGVLLGSIEEEKINEVKRFIQGLLLSDEQENAP